MDTILYWIIPFLILIFTFGGYSVAKGKGMTSRRWIFISVLSCLFVMTGLFAAQLAVDKLLSQPVVPSGHGQWNTDYYGSDSYLKYEEDGIKFRENKEMIEGMVLLVVGIVGLVLTSMFRQRRTGEIGYSFGAGGAILAISGLLVLLANKGVSVKFIASVGGVIIISYLMYRYRDFLMGEKKEGE